ncbi:hypothetical protein BAOM_3412 [Peribacillus asahii]|uniref:Uncharacterized protein n=1 Tax=Peribacillus asahii TaxID=228899 RepID=A0A3T0KUW1_9BACI|nr:hypothetical protein BAOM_3412 [Peribacillus asahii]
MQMSFLLILRKTLSILFMTIEDMRLLQTVEKLFAPSMRSIMIG